MNRYQLQYCGRLAVSAFLMMSCDGGEGGSSTNVGGNVGDQSETYNEAAPSSVISTGTETSEAGQPAANSAECGNGILEEGESCDDGTNNTDSYTAEKTCNSSCLGFAPILTDCQAGEFVSTPHTTTSDRVCGRCRAGVDFSATVNAAICLPVQSCNATEYESIGATTTSDRDCTSLTLCDENATETQAATATSDRVCTCNAGYDGDGASCVDVDIDDDGYEAENDCDDTNPQSTIKAEDPGCTFETALATGDARGLNSTTLPLDFALQYLADMTRNAEASLRAIYGDASLTFVPKKSSQWVETTDYQNKFAFVLGEQGNNLALAGTQYATPCAAFGDDVVARFSGNEQLQFEPAFVRLLSWLVAGDADDSAEVSMAKVGFMGLGGHYNQVSTWFEGTYPLASYSDCDDMSTAASCVANLDLLVLGAHGEESDSKPVELLVDDALYRGVPVLYLHTKGWDVSDYGNGVLAGMDMSIGPYGGNYWAQDQAQWDSIDDLIAAGGALESVARVLNHLKQNDLSFDFSVCTTSVGKTSCGNVVNLAENFLDGALKIKNFMWHLDQTGQRLFEMEGKRFWKSLLLYTDRLRQEIAYPMSKTDTDIMPFMKAYFADHVVHYNRTSQMAQADLGTFSDPINMDEVNLVTIDKDITLSLYGGFTAIGAYALPGQAFTIERLDNSDINIDLKINTQRTGSTREWDDDKYDRPKFLQSPKMPVTAGTPITFSSPYGGVLEVVSDETESAVWIQLRLTLVGGHPVLTDIADADAYLSALQSSPYPITEVKTGGVEIHSKTDKMLKAINAEPYNGNLSYFFSDLDKYMVKDTYNLAGYAGEGLSLNTAVAAYCTNKGWDCTSESIHGSPSTQHINIDTYAHCGAGCSGNPYDQTWPLEPLGWGETHEIGHNLQPGRLRIYGDRSGEVSNQIFPLHKHYVYQGETGESLSADRVSYEACFDILQIAVSELDPVQSVYQRIWSSSGYAANNDERMNFYMQLIHTSDELDYLSSGWDLYTLLYLQERLFNQAIKDASDWDNQKEALGFGTYEDAPGGIDGNDFMLIAVSSITQKDQRDFFEMWGITYSDAASAQVASFGYDPAPKIYFANDDTNTDPHPTPVVIDGTSRYPEFR